jgi:hypothetical protein
VADWSTVLTFVAVAEELTACVPAPRTPALPVGCWMELA